MKSKVPDAIRVDTTTITPNQQLVDELHKSIIRKFQNITCIYLCCIAFGVPNFLFLLCVDDIFYVYLYFLCACFIP